MQVVASVFIFFALGVNTAILLAVAVTALRWAAEPGLLLSRLEDVAADTAERLIAWLKQLEELEPPPGWEERARAGAAVAPHAREVVVSAPVDAETFDAELGMINAKLGGLKDRARDLGIGGAEFQAKLRRAEVLVDEARSCLKPGGPS